MNARFIVIINDSPVKITLRPGKALKWRKSWVDDEGSGWQGEQWEYEGNFVFNHWGRGGRDCDGRISEGGKNYCHLMDLKRKECYGYPGIMTPNWVYGKKRARDEYAEMMNY